MTTRNWDPDTSQHTGQLAAQKNGRNVRTIKAGSPRWEVLDVFRENDDLTAEEAASQASDLATLYGRRSYPETFRRRVSDLVQAGYIEDTGDRRPGASGALRVVYRITHDGIRALEAL